MKKEDLRIKIQKLKTPKILVVGDFAIDEMVFGQTSRISREAPVLILEHTKTQIILGAASNAAHNISSLNNGKVNAIGVYGDDYYGKILLNTLNEAKINTELMVKDTTRPTTTKTRISGSCSQSVTQQVVRIDRQCSDKISKDIEEKIIKNLEIAIPKCDAVILSDYHLGVLTDKIISKTIEIANKHNIVTACDVQKDLNKYRGATIITPNQPDTEKFLGYFIKNEDDLNKAGKELLNKLNVKNVLITRGADGMMLFEQNGNVTKIPAFNKTEVFDVTGAGDTVVAAVTLGLASNLTPKEAAVIGNIAASIVIRHFGCHVCTCEEIEENLNKITYFVEK